MVYTDIISKQLEECRCQIRFLRRKLSACKDIVTYKITLMEIHNTELHMEKLDILMNKFCLVKDAG